MRKLTLLSLLLAVGCSEGILGTEQDVPSHPDQAIPFIQRTETRVSADDISAIAPQIVNNGILTRSSDENTIESIDTICDDSGHPVFYIVNFCDNQGFLIMSSSLRYYPVLAYVEHGTFDENDILLKDILSQYKLELLHNENSLEVDAQAEFLDMWRRYETSYAAVNTPVYTRDDGILTLRSDFIHTWEEQGYDCFSLDERPEGLPESIYENWCETAESVAHPDYNSISDAIIVRRTTRVHDSVPALLSTLWNQDYPYNYGLDGLFSSTDAAAGCVTIALGQIMKYHQWPSRYNWSNMPNNAVSYCADLSNFIQDLFDDVILLPYQNDWSMSHIQPVIKSVLKNQYDYNASLDTHNALTVKSSLSSGNPVFMMGSENGILSDRHAWVCDGFNYSELCYHFELYVVSIVEPPLQYEFISSHDCSSANTFFHMNWGHSPSSNGWFTDMSYPSNEPWTTLRTDMIIQPDRQ